MLDHHQRVHPYDSDGVRGDFPAGPCHLPPLHDDPYRSLAAELCRAGGFAKDVTPFSEFLWADFFRNHSPVSLIEQDVSQPLMKAKKIARTRVTGYLPGWCGACEAR